MTPARMFDGDLYVLAADAVKMAENAYKNGQTDEREHATEEANRRANASWTLMCEKMVAAEREACAKVCENYDIDIAAAIRARGEASIRSNT